MKLFNLFIIAVLAVLFTTGNNVNAQTIKGNEALVSAEAPKKITKTELTSLITDFQSKDNVKSFKAYNTIIEKLMTTLTIQKDEIRQASESGKSVDKLMEVNKETINYYNKLNGPEANNPDGTMNKANVLKTLNQLSAFLFG